MDIFNRLHEICELQRVKNEQFNFPEIQPKDGQRICFKTNRTPGFMFIGIFMGGECLDDADINTRLCTWYDVSGWIPLQNNN